MTQTRSLVQQLMERVSELLKNEDVLRTLATLGGAQPGEQSSGAQLTAFALKLVQEILSQQNGIQSSGVENHYPAPVIQAFSAQGLNSPEGRALSQIEALAAGRDPNQLALERAMDPNQLIIDKKVEQYRSHVAAGRFEVPAPQFTEDQAFLPYTNLWSKVTDQTRSTVIDLQKRWEAFANWWGAALEGKRPSTPMPEFLLSQQLEKMALPKVEARANAELSALRDDLKSGKATVEQIQGHLERLDNYERTLGPGWVAGQLEKVFGQDAGRVKELLDFRAQFIEGKKEYWHQVAQSGKTAADAWDAEHYQPLREVRDRNVNDPAYGLIVKATQAQAVEIHDAYASLVRAKEDWFQSHYSGQPTAQWEKAGTEARARLGKADPDAEALWGPSAEWHVNQEMAAKLSTFDQAYRGYWEALVKGEESALQQAELALQKAPGFFGGPASTSIDQEYQAKLKEAYMAAHRSLAEGHDEARAQIDFWKGHVSQSLLKEWDAQLAREPGPRSGSGSYPLTQEEAKSFNVFTMSGLTGPQLDDLLKGTDMHGLGQYYADAEAKYGVNALFMIAKDAHETGWGTSDAFGDLHNTGGYMDGDHLRTFSSHQESIDFGAGLMAGSLYQGSGLHTIPEIQGRYAPTGAQNDPDNLNSHWTNGLSSIMAELGQKAHARFGNDTHTRHEDRLSSPVGPYRVSSHFHAGEPFRANAHTGIDLIPLDSAANADVHVAAGGRVIHAGFSPGLDKYGRSAGYGNFVDIDHGNGVITRYAHLKEGSLQVEVGDEVAAGQTLGQMGHTGHTEILSAEGEWVAPDSGDARWDGANHVHFEVRINGDPVDPDPYLKDEKSI